MGTLIESLTEILEATGASLISRELEKLGLDLKDAGGGFLQPSLAGVAFPFSFVVKDGNVYLDFGYEGWDRFKYEIPDEFEKESAISGVRVNLGPVKKFPEVITKLRKIFRYAASDAKYTSDILAAIEKALRSYKAPAGWATELSKPNNDSIVFTAKKGPVRLVLSFTRTPSGDVLPGLRIGYPSSQKDEAKKIVNLRALKDKKFLRSIGIRRVERGRDYGSWDLMWGASDMKLAPKLLDALLK